MNNSESGSGERVYVQGQLLDLVRDGSFDPDADPSKVAMALAPDHVGLIRGRDGEYRPVPQIPTGDKQIDDFMKVLRERERLNQVRAELVREGRYSIEETGG